MGSWLRRLLGSSATAGDTPLAPVLAAPLAPLPDASLLGWQPRIDVDALFGAWLLVDGTGAGPGDPAADAAFIARFDTVAAHAPAASLVPRVPAIVPQLLQTLRDPAGTPIQLSRQVAQDPLLVAGVLRLANSPAHGLRGRVASLEQALLVIGQDGLRQLLASVAFRPIISQQSGRAARRGAPRVWDQSERAGMACHLLAPLAGVVAFEAFLAALLQNVGMVVALRLVDQADLRACPAALGLGGTLTGRARGLACRIGADWAFPPAVTGAIAAVGKLDGAPPRTALADLLRVVDTLAKLRVLADAALVARDDPALDLVHHPALARCFGMLDAAPA